MYYLVQDVAHIVTLFVINPSGRFRAIVDSCFFHERQTDGQTSKQTSQVMKKCYYFYYKKKQAKLTYFYD